ncbi:uncharacterized protein [Ambystoma mexicanum]|uniref:uncharacterized protein n=1 Tax=Ambystoma mexicanum TaxID=8296 RepID=UPI0037E98102
MHQGLNGAGIAHCEQDTEHEDMSSVLRGSMESSFGDYGPGTTETVDRPPIDKDDNMVESLTAYWDTMDSRQQVAVEHCLELALQWIKRRRTGATETVFPDPNPNPGPSTATASERKIPLVTDGTCRFADVLVNPVKLREIVVTARKSQTGNPARYLQNKLLDLLFTKEELMAAKGRLTLDRHRQDAIQEFIHVKSREIGFPLLSAAEYRKALQNKIGNYRIKKKAPNLVFSTQV